MYKISMIIRTWFTSLFEIETRYDDAGDPLAQMSPRELADLPVHHPRLDRCLTS